MSYDDDYEVVVGCDAAHPDRHGGQHVARQCPAVRILHRPSGLAVTSTSERSQHGNRERAYVTLQLLLLSPDEVVKLRLIRADLADFGMVGSDGEYDSDAQDAALTLLDRLITGVAR